MMESILELANLKVPHKSLFHLQIWEKHSPPPLSYSSSPPFCCSCYSTLPQPLLFPPAFCHCDSVRRFGGEKALPPISLTLLLFDGIFREGIGQVLEHITVLLQSPKVTEWTIIWRFFIPILSTPFTLLLLCPAQPSAKGKGGERGDVRSEWWYVSLSLSNVPFLLCTLEAWKNASIFGTFFRSHSAYFWEGVEEISPLFWVFRGKEREKLSEQGEGERLNKQVR